MASTPPIKDLDDVIERFWNKVEKTDDCWNWTAYRDKRGYGMYHTAKNHGLFESYYAHRISYYIANGEYDTTLDVCHKCDNPSCVNPNHLFLGTHQDNMQDMTNKGRNPMQKLDWDTVREIRELHSKGGVSQKKLSEQFNVSHSTVNFIVNNKIWVE